MPTESHFPLLRPALLKLVGVLSHAALDKAGDLAHAARTNPVFLAKLAAKAVPIIGFVPALMDAEETFLLTKRFGEWDRERADAYLLPRAMNSTVGLIQVAQTAVLTGSALAYAAGMSLAPHHPIAAAPFFAAGAGAQALGLLMEASADPVAVEARQILQTALREAERPSAAQENAPTPPRSFER